MKKNFLAVLTLLLSLLLVACGGDPDKKSDAGAAG